MENNKQDDQVTIPRSQLEGLLQRVSALESVKQVQEEGQGLHPTGWQEIREEDRKYKATVRKWRETPDDEWKFAVDLYYHHLAKDPVTGEKDLIYRFKWIKESTKGGEEIQEKETMETEMKLSDFVKNSIAEKCEIFDKEVKKLQMATGEQAQVSKVDYAKFKTTHQGTVAMIVTADKITWKVKLPNGRIIRLPAERLNL